MWCATHLVYLVPDEDLDHTFSAVRVELSEPAQELIEGRPCRDVVYYSVVSLAREEVVTTARTENHSLGASVVARRQRPEPLLSGRVLVVSR